MILLDTNVISQAMHPRGSGAVRRWLDAQLRQDLFLCAPVVAELRYGVERLPDGERKAHFDSALARLITAFGPRILAFDLGSSQHYGRLRAQRAMEGRTVGPVDLMIAAIAVDNRLEVATRNIADFDGLGLTLINPFESSAP